MKPLVLVVPCYNEAERLDLVAFEAALHARPHLRVLFVDDGSRDATRRILTEWTKRLPSERANLLRLDENVGKAEAVRQGVLAVIDQVTEGLQEAFAVGYWDADLSTPLEEVDRLAAMLDEQPAALAILGARVRLMGKQIRRQALRHYAGRVFATLAALVLRFSVYDTQCGAKLFRIDDRTRPLFDRPFISDWAFDVELLARIARWHGCDIGPRRVVLECPLDRWMDVGGSKVRLRDLPRMLLDLERIRRGYQPK